MRSLSLLYIGTLCILATYLYSCKRDSQLGPLRHFEINGSTLDNNGCRGNITIKVLRNGVAYLTATSDANANYNVQFTASLDQGELYEFFVYDTDSMTTCLDSHSINVAELQNNNTDLKFTYEFNFTITYYTRVHFHIKNVNPYDGNDRLDSLGRLSYYLNNPIPQGAWIDDLTGMNVDTTITVTLGRSNQDYYYFETKNAVRTFVTEWFAIGENEEDAYVDVYY